MSVYSIQRAGRQKMKRGWQYAEPCKSPPHGGRLRTGVDALKKDASSATSCLHPYACEGTHDK